MILDIFGTIRNPFTILGVPDYAAGPEDVATFGLIKFLNNVIRLLILVGGLFAFFNLILAGYGFMSAGDDPKKMAAAWAKIWQSMLGLLFIVGSFVLAAIFGYLLFRDPGALLMPKLYGPGM